MISHAAQSGQHPHADRGLDFYATPPQAVAALLTTETLSRCLWDPSAGNGGLVGPLREAGHVVFASDIGPILDNGQLTRVHVFKHRLPMMHPDGWTGPRASSAIPFAWFVWERDHIGPTMLDRIPRERPGTLFEELLHGFAAQQAKFAGEGKAVEP